MCKDSLIFSRFVAKPVIRYFFSLLTYFFALLHFSLGLVGKFGLGLFIQFLLVPTWGKIPLEMRVKSGCTKIRALLLFIASYAFLKGHKYYLKMYMEP